jgi:tetratricopeptide (TPR) repeat protein
MLSPALEYQFSYGEIGAYFVERSSPLTIHRAVWMLPLLPPLAAYQADLAAARKRAIGHDDGQWLALALQLRHLRMQDGGGRAQVARALDERLATLLGSHARPLLDPVDDGPPTMAARIRLLSERVEDAAMWHLALAVLRESTPLAESALEQGRFWAHQARIARQLGDFEVATTLYRRTGREGRRAREPELSVRAWLGLAGVAQVRGNYPDVERWARRALGLAPRHGLDALTSLAHHFLLVRAGTRGDLPAALVHGWTAYRFALGNPILEAERLLNVAQVLLDVGAASTAVNGFIAALRHRLPDRLALPAWGGLAASAALAGTGRALVDRASNKVLALSEGPAPAYAVAAALVESARARRTLALTTDAWTERARALAASHGFHELMHALEHLDAPDHPHRENAADVDLPAAAERIRETVAGLATPEDAYALT